MKIGNLNVELQSNKRGGFVLGNIGDVQQALIDSGSLPDIEMRWIRLEKGEQKSDAHSHFDTRALLVLIKGKHEITFSKKEQIVLQKEGDYIVIEPEEEHEWYTKEDTTLLAIRWKNV